MRHRKTKAFWIRVTPEEHQEIINKAKTNGYTSVSAYLRDTSTDNYELERKIRSITSVLEEILSKLKEVVE